MEDQKTDFEAFSYRTSSRFGSVVEVSLDSGLVTVTGPRIGIIAYGLWIALQLALLTLVLASLVTAVVVWDWRCLVLALALLLVHLAVGGLGAGALWEGARLTAFGLGEYPSVSFPVSVVKRVSIGRGWARRGLWLVIPYAVPGIDKTAEGHAVSFEAPDGERGKDVVYALHVRTEDEAKALAALLEGR